MSKNKLLFKFYFKTLIILFFIFFGFNIFAAVPDQITGLYLTGVNKQVLVGWYKPSSSVITDYQIEYKKSSDSSWTIFNDGVSTNTKTAVNNLDNNIAYDFKVTAINSDGPGLASSVFSATPHQITTMAFVFTGESNSGGLGLNSSATTDELASRSSVQITNLTSGNFLYENLDIGVNNLRDHLGLPYDAYTANHGFELQLANSVEAHEFPGISQVYLTKTGQGGANLSYWITHKPYIGIYAWDKFLERINAAKTQLPVDRQWIVLLNEGMNDRWNGVYNDLAAYKSGMITFINNIKTELPGAIIVMTQFQSVTENYYVGYDSTMDEIAAEEPNVFVVSSANAEMKNDGLHWTYVGLKTVGERFATITRNALGMYYLSEPINFNTTPDDNSILVSWTSPLFDNSSSVTDYQIEYKKSSNTDWTILNDGVSTNTSIDITNLESDTNYDFRVTAINSLGLGLPSVIVTSKTNDITPPTITNITSTKENGSYKYGDTIELTINFSENVDSTLDVLVNLNSGGSCVFTVQNTNIATCIYTIGHTDESVDLDVVDVVGVVKDASLNTLVSPAIPTTNLSSLKDLVVYIRRSSGGGSGGGSGSYSISLVKKDEIKLPLVIEPKEQSKIQKSTKILKLNLLSEEVRDIQKYLNTHGYEISKTGAGSIGKETTKFGPLTKKAVIRFQKANNITPDGIVGPKTRELMK